MTDFVGTGDFVGSGDNFDQSLPQRFWRLCRRVENGRQATRLWNWADGQISPELYWNLMRIRLPWFFDDIRDPNSARLEG